MNKTFIIIRREYLTRVRRRAFILSTFLFPIVMILFIVGSVYLAVKSKEVVKIAVPNDSFLKSSLKSDTSSVLFVFDPTIDQSNFSEKGYTGFLRPNRDSSSNKTYTIVSRKQIAIESKDAIEHQLNKALEDKLLQEKGIDKSILDSVSSVSTNAINVSNITVDESGKDAAKTG